MITRREMNRTMTAALATFFAGSSGAFLRSKTPPCPQNAEGHMSNISPIAVQTLIEEPLSEMSNPEVTVLTLTVAPGSTSLPHRHTGPVFAYILEGEIENQVDPDPPQTYKANQFFYEPPLHVHRSLRNMSQTEAAKVLVFQIGEKGKQFTIGAS